MYDPHMRRLTRAQSQSRNREALLRTARELFLRDGYQVTSLAAVAEAAGFSTGAVYSNFAGKAELALLVLQEIQAEQLAALGPVIGPERSLEEMLEGVRGWAQAALGSGWPRLELEFAIDARTDKALVAIEADRQRTAVVALAAAIQRRLPDGAANLMSADAMAEAAIDLAIGIGVRRVIVPEVTADSLIDGLRGVLAAFDAP